MLYLTTAGTTVEEEVKEKEEGWQRAGNSSFSPEWTAANLKVKYLLTIGILR